MPENKVCWRFSLGRSMIEMLGVLAIIGVLSAGGIMGYSAAMDSYKTNQTIEDMRIITASVLSSFPKNERLSLGTTHLCQLGIVQEPYCSAKTRWGTLAFGFDVVYRDNCIDWNTINKGSGPCTIIGMSLYGIPKSACVKLITNDWSNFSPAYGVLIAEHGNVAAISPAKVKLWRSQKQPPPSVAEAETACTKTTYDYLLFEARFYLTGTPL